MIDDHGLAFDVYRTLPGLILCLLDLWVRIMNPLKKGQLQEEDGYMWGCGVRPHPHIYQSLVLAAVFFSALNNFRP